MLHEVAASDLDLTNIVNPVRKLLKRVNFFAGEVESIDLDRTGSHMASTIITMNSSIILLLTSRLRGGSVPAPAGHGQTPPAGT